MGRSRESHPDCDRGPDRIKEVIRRDPFAKRLGITLEELRPGYARVAMTVTEEMRNFHGIPHGGAVFALADAAFAAAGNSHGTQAVALHMSISYLAAARVGSRLTASAQEERRTRRTGLYRITVTDEDGELIASCQGLVYRRDRPLAVGRDEMNEDDEA